MMYDVYEVNIDNEGRWTKEDDLGSISFSGNLNKGHLLFIENKFYAVVDIIHNVEHKEEVDSVLTVMEVNEEIPDFYKKIFK